MARGTGEVHSLLNNAQRTSTEDAKMGSNGRSGIILTVDVTAAGGAAPSITPKILVYDESSDSYMTYWTAASAITTTGDFVYVLYPGASGGDATEVDGLPLPDEFKLEITHANTDNITYSVGYQLIP